MAATRRSSRGAGAAAVVALALAASCGTPGSDVDVAHLGTTTSTECEDLPRVAVRDATGQRGELVLFGSYETCAGTIVEGIGISGADYWPDDAPPLSGDGPLTVTVTPAPEELTAEYHAEFWRGSGEVVALTPRSLGGGRFEIDPPPSAGCWFLNIQNGGGHTLAVQSGPLDAACPTL